MKARELHLGLVGPLPPPSGGMANQCRQLARLLGEDGARVEVVQTNAPYRPAWAGRVRGLRALFRFVPYLFALWRAAGRVQVFHIMANSGWNWHLVAAPAVWIARLRGIPAIVNYRGGGAGPFMQRSARRVLPTLRRASAVVVPSGFLQKVFEGYGVSCVVVPNIIDLARFKPRAEPRRGQPHVVVTRNLEPVYDIGTALRAFALVLRQLPQARLSVAGSGPERAALESLARELGIDQSVRFTGRLDNDAMGQLYADADVMVNPSLVDNMPISVLEALASGVPVVSTNVGGVPYVVDDGRTALLVPPADAESMARAVLRILQGPDLAAHLSQAGLVAVQRYAWSEVRELWLRAYGDAMEGGARGQWSGRSAGA